MQDDLQGIPFRLLSRECETFNIIPSEKQKLSDVEERMNYHVL